MLAISDEEALYLLEFTDRPSLENEVECLRKKTKRVVVPGTTAPIKSIEKELTAYFNEELQEFQTPLLYLGSPFQKRVWEELKKIPFGQTRSYLDIARLIGNPSAFRAVANANGANMLAIVIPCHRVINANGELGGYGCGTARKKQLIDLEKQTLIIK